MLCWNESDFLSKKDHSHNHVLLGKVSLQFFLELFQYVICADKFETHFKAIGNVVARCLTKNTVMKTCGRVDVYEQLLAFLTSAIEGVMWSASRPSNGV
jgi:hypothetical protein